MQHIKHTQFSFSRMGLVNIHLKRQKTNKQQRKNNLYPFFFSFLVFRINDGISFSYSSCFHIAVNQENPEKCDYLRCQFASVLQNIHLLSCPDFDVSTCLKFPPLESSFRPMHYISRR